MTRDEVIALIEAVDECVKQLRPRLERQPEAALPTGTWRVRDALSHLAARANPVPNALRRFEAAADATAQGQQPARVDVDDINAGQVEARSDCSVVEILDEIQAGHRAAIDAIGGLTDEQLARTIPAIQGGDVSMAEMLARSGARHENNHLDEVEKALTPRATASG